MRNFQDTFQTRKGSFIDTFSICMTVPLKVMNNEVIINSIEIYHRFLAKGWFMLHKISVKTYQLVIYMQQKMIHVV